MLLNSVARFSYFISLPSGNIFISRKTVACADEDEDEDDAATSVVYKIGN